MSNIKHLADLVKVCSILPALAIMPAMADGYTVVPETLVNESMNMSGRYDWMDASTDSEEQSVWWLKGADVTVAENTVFANNKADVGIFSVSIKAPTSLTLKEGVLFENNSVRFDGGAVANYNALKATGVTFRKNTAQMDYENDVTPMGGGAIALGSESNTIIERSKFFQNESKYHGGAIGMRGPDDGDNSAATLDIKNSEFAGNIATQNGGAIYSTFYDSVTERNAVYMKDTDFTGNSAQSGGAIYVDGGTDKAGNKASMKIVGGDMDANIAEVEGGAIHNNSSLVLNGVDFGNNLSGIDGGAIFNTGALTISGGEYEDNRASKDAWTDGGYGGAIFSKGKLSITDGAVFEDNMAFAGGAIYGSRWNTDGMTIDGVTFRNNKAVADAGALGVYDNALSTVKNTKFYNNKVAVVTDGITVGDIVKADGAGALSVGQLANVNIENVEFVGNESGVRGGAMALRHQTDRTVNMDVVLFENNKAGAQGGAFANGLGGTVNVKNGSFVGNWATQSGGAVYNGSVMNYGGADVASPTKGDGVVNFDGVNVFQNNSTKENGGAIFNGTEAMMTMAGTNTFTGNTANGLANDIHNMGTFTIASGETTIDGGITGTGSFTVASGATFNIGDTTVEQGEFVLNGVLGVDVLSATQFGKVDADEISGSGTVKLNVASVGTYNIFGANNEFTFDAGKTFIVTNNGASGIKVELQDVETLATSAGISSQAASVVSALAQSGNANVQKISLAMQQALNAKDVETVEKETAKTAPTSKPVAQAVASSVQNQILTMTGKRMAAISPVGRNGGDALESAGVWVQGMFNKSKLADQFHGYTRGFAMGGDMLINDDLTIGGGYSYSNADIHADARHTDVESNSIFVYGQYKPAEWYVNGTLTYTMSDYDEQTQMLGGELTAQFDVDAYGAQFMTGYDFASGLTPEVGIRYLHVSQDAYDNGLVSSDELDGDYLSGVAGVKYAFDIANDWGMMLRPELRAGVTYDFLSDANDITVVMPGAPAYVLAGDRLSRMGGEFGIGMTTEYRGVQVSLNYDLTVHEDYTSQTGMVKFRYDF